MGNLSGSLIGFADLINFFDEISEQEHGTWYVGTIVEYAPDQEFGTQDIPAQPFLRPAVEKARHNLVKIIEEGLEDLETFTIDDEIKIVALQVEKQAKDFAPVDTGNLMGSITAGPSLEKMEKESLSNADFIK